MKSTIPPYVFIKTWLVHEEWQSKHMILAAYYDIETA